MSRYDWTKSPVWAKYAATDEDGRVYFFKDKPHKSSNCFLAYDSKYKVMSVEDWADSLEERPKWEPKVNERCYGISAFYNSGYVVSFYSSNNHAAYERGYIVKTEEEAIAKVKELGW